MKLVLNIVFVIFIGYYCFRFASVLLKLRGNIVLPSTEEEMAVIRKFPMRAVSLPIFPKQKWGFILYILMLVYLIVMFSLGAMSPNISWSYYLLLLIPLLHSHNLLNVFAIVEDGVISGDRYVPWKRITSFHFVPIDESHRFYGYSDEVNKGYELKLRGRMIPVSCFVTSNEMKEKMTVLLSSNIK
jgi:hypothetical protein